MNTYHLIAPTVERRICHRRFQLIHSLIGFFRIILQVAIVEL